MTSEKTQASQFAHPGRSKGILEAGRKRYLTSLLVHKELRVRYRGSVLGMLWSYAKPATQFLVFYLAVGVFMGMNRNIENYIIYMFSGVILINYFSEAFANSTRAVVANTALVKKIYLPRELFPISSIWVALIHFGPQVLILLIGSVVVGWHPGLMSLAAIFLAVIIVTIFALGLGLLGAAANVFFRDAENFVDLILMIATWISPVLYQWTMVENSLQGGSRWVWALYQVNPMTAAVELFHYGFWGATLPPGALDVTPPGMKLWTIAALGISIVILLIGELVFRSVEHRFAQEL